MKKLILAAALISAFSLQPSAFAQTPVAPLRVNPNTGAIVDQANFASGNNLPTLNGNNTFTGNNTLNGTTTFGNATQVRSALSLGTLATQNGTFSGTSSGNNTGDQTLAGLGGVSLNGTNTFGSNGSLNFTGSPISYPITLPASSAIQGIRWDGSGNGTAIGYETSQHKIRITSKKRIDLLPAQDFQGDGFIQLGNNGKTSEYIFISQEGGAQSAYQNVPSHRFNFNSAWWNGNASVDRVATMQGNTDSGGNATIEFFSPGSSGAGTYNGTLERYTYSSGNKTLTISNTGLALNSGNITGLNRANATPALSGNGSPTSGIAFFASDVQIVRSGTTQAYTDSAGFTVATNFFPLSAVYTSAGSVGSPAISRSSTASSGIYWPTAHALAVSSQGVEQVRWTTAGTQIGANGTAMARVRHGTATLVNGTVTVSDATITDNARIMATRSGIAASTALGTISKGTVTPSTSFVLNSRKSDTTIETGDQSTVDYIIVEP